MEGLGALALGAAAGGLAVALVMALTLRRRRAAAEGSASRAAHELERVRTEAANERAVQDLILASMEEGVLLVDRDGVRVFANAALARHLQLDPERTTDLHPEVLHRAVSRSSFTGSPAHLEFQTGVPPRWLRAAVLPAGAEGAVLLVVDDITEARRLDAVRRDFVANASHELKSPVASIRAVAETLRDGAFSDPPAAARFTEQLEHEAVRLSRIVTDLLDLSRLESGSERVEQVHLDAIATEEAERSQARATEAGVILQVRADGVPSIRGSGRDLSLLVRNLIENAIGYTPEGGRVDVEVRAEPERVLLEVRDTGVGIPRRDLPRIFERFYRVDPARSRATGGTGLGLAIVKHVAENHGGSVRVTSELSAGTTVAVVLPRQAAEPAP